MTKLNETQQEILEQAREAAAKVALLDALAEAEFKAQKEQNRSLLREVGTVAAAAGVPIRQFGLAIGTSDFKTIKGFYPEKGDS